jgi:hypothetical protein
MNNNITFYRDGEKILASGWIDYSLSSPITKVEKNKLVKLLGFLDELQSRSVDAGEYFEWYDSI